MAIIVTAAVIRREGKVLVARRATGAHAGKWEFPGGKCEPGEAPALCLVREMNEEFEGSFEVGNFISAVAFTVGERQYELQAFWVKLLSNSIVPLEHTEIAWVPSSELDSYDLLGPDQDILKAIRAIRAP